MRTIIAGSRTAIHYNDLIHAVAAAPWKLTMVISGAARGADALGERWARDNAIPLLRMPADWHTHGKRAGYFRNVEMADKAQALIALWDGASRGTAHMIETARSKGLLVSVWRIPQS
jgi:hypothetical protein